MSQSTQGGVWAAIDASNSIQTHDPLTAYICCSFASELEYVKN